MYIRMYTLKLVMRGVCNHGGAKCNSARHLSPQSRLRQLPAVFADDRARPPRVVLFDCSAPPRTAPHCTAPHRTITHPFKGTWLHTSWINKKWFAVCLLTFYFWCLAIFDCAGSIENEILRRSIWAKLVFFKQCLKSLLIIIKRLFSFQEPSALNV